MLALDPIELARDTLLDPDGIRWIDTDMLRWVGDALRAISVLRPPAAATTISTQLTADSVLQSLPTDAFVLLDVRRNMGADGATPGKPIRDVDYDSLRAFETTWYSGTGETEIDNFAYRMAEDPLVFWVSPKTHAVTPVYVEMTYAKVFPNPESMSEELPLGDEYKTAIAEYITAKALSVDSDISDPQKAEMHMQAFAAMVGGLAGGDSS